MCTVSFNYTSCFKNVPSHICNGSGTEGQNIYGKENTGKKQGQFTGQRQLNEATQDNNTKSKLKLSLNHKLNQSVFSTAKVERELATQETHELTQATARSSRLAPRLTAPL